MKYAPTLLISILIYWVVFAIATGILAWIGFLFPIKLQFLIAFIHFLGLVSVGATGFFKREMMGLVYLTFLIIKMGAFLFLFYQFPEVKTALMPAILLYLFYLFLETALIIRLIHTATKTKQKS